MSQKNFASYGDMETLVAEIADKCGPYTEITYEDWLQLTPYQQEHGRWDVTGVPGIKLDDRFAYVDITMADTIDTQVTVSMPSGFSCANSVVIGCSYQRNNDLWYAANSEFILYGAFSDYAYAIPKSSYTVGCKCRIAFLKIV